MTPARLLLLLLRILSLCGLLAAPALASATDMPRDKGLPISIQTGVAFVKLLGFDENAGSFEATIDLRLRWQDTRLARADGNMTSPPQTLRDAAAEQKLRDIWTPEISLANQLGEASLTENGVRIFADGTVEILRRVTAHFAADVDVTRFPFDRQQLSVEVAVKGAPITQIALRSSQSDIDFSRPSRDADLTGWTTGLVDLRAAPVSGWYNTTSARIIASLDIARQPGLVVASIFIPLIASLLIPLLAIWLNRMDEGVFQIDTFELVNIIIGGLFTVIALNFTIFSSYPALAVGDNTVNRMLALNYMTLATALLVSILFGRFNVVARGFGIYVQEQAYIFVMWAVPFSVFILASAILWVAYV